MENANLCQSCGMPLTADETKGTNKDGSFSEEYCVYCFKNGAFTQDISIEEMIELNMKYLDEWNEENNQEYSVPEARKQLKEFIPTLKRWQQRI